MPKRDVSTVAKTNTVPTEVPSWTTSQPPASRISAGPVVCRTRVSVLKRRPIIDARISRWRSSFDRHGELSVGELVQRLGQARPKVSNHLACLRWCGFVERARRHPNVFYRVADDRVIELLRLGRELLADNAEHVAACRRVGASGC
jgi:DNA-binding transcriptional ArsR family regulator